MPGFGVGIMNNTINSKYGPKPPIQADYMTAVACGADSFWVADHLNSVLRISNRSHASGFSCRWGFGTGTSNP